MWVVVCLVCVQSHNLNACAFYYYCIVVYVYNMYICVVEKHCRFIRVVISTYSPEDSDNPMYLTPQHTFLEVFISPENA